MNKKKKTAIEPTRLEDYNKWYQEVIKEADLAENSLVRGCMIIKNWGYNIWENIQYILNKKIKELGVQNFYFPIFIPLSLLQKEAEHVEGFAKECAVVTHHRLEIDENNNLNLAGKLEEPLILRPTSEVVIGEAFSRWIKSYKDLPLLGNQWANVIRWEMRPRIFLRTSEFLWQEGHTAHATKEEAEEFSKLMIEVYKDFIESYLAIPLIMGQKTENEKFPGAETTYTIEAMMQDKKALQMGTSHFLGQSFSKAFEIKFQSKNETQEYVWTTSWGVSTRMIGGLIMTHSDDNGLVLPPKIAETSIMILPIIHKEESSAEILGYCEELKSILNKKKSRIVKAEIDKSDKRYGDKKWSWIKKGIPIIIEIGLEEIRNNAISFIERINIEKKNHLNKEEFHDNIIEILLRIQNEIFNKALKYQKEHIKRVNTIKEFYSYFTQDDTNNMQNGVFILAYWSQDNVSELQIKQDLKVTPRCIGFEYKNDKGKCIFTGKENSDLVLFARSY